MARINHEAVRASQYAMTHNWNFILKNLPTGLTDTARYSGLLGDNGILNLHMESTDIPESPLTMATGTIRGVQVSQPMITKSEQTFAGSFLERDDYLISSFFNDWSQLGGDRKLMTSKPKFQSLVLNGCDLQLLNGEAALVATFKFNDIIPTTVKLIAPSADASIQKVSVTFAFTNFDRVNA